MPRNLGAWLIGVGVFLVLAFNTIFIVPESKQAIILNFGEYKRTINAVGADEAGLHIKAPFADAVVYYERRNLGVTLEEQTVVAADQERLIVDAFLRWRIVDPRRFYQAATTEAGGVDRLGSLTEAALRRALGGATSNEIISGRRAALMQAIEDDLNRDAATELGVQVADVRIRRADLPEATQDQVFERMRTERQQVAARIRAEGLEAAARIRAEAERDVIVIQATAREESERLRGAGDGERARIFARAYSRDADFAAFYRSMRAYENALDAGTPIVVPPDGDFFRFLRSRDGNR